MADLLIMLVLMVFSETFTLTLGIFSFSEYKYKWYFKWIYFSLMYVITYLAHLFIMSRQSLMDHPAMVLFIGLLYFGSSSLILRIANKDWNHNIFVTTYAIIVAILSSFVGHMVAGVLMMFNLPIIESHLSMILFNILIIIAVNFGGVRIVATTFRRVDVHAILKTAYSRLFAGSMAGLLIVYYVVLFVSNLLEGVDEEQMLILQSLYFAILSIMALFIIILFNGVAKKQTVIEDSEDKVVAMDDHVQVLNESQIMLEKFRHDNQNMLTALMGSIDSGELDVVKGYLEEYGADFERVIDLGPDSPDVSNLRGSKLMPIRTLILSKAGRARKLDIKFTVEAYEPIDEINLSSVDLVRIIGIWLDNAIEAAEIAEDKWVHISFINDEDDLLIIRVSNSCLRELPVSISDMRKSGISSKGAGRGYGLSNVYDLVSAYDHVHLSTKQDGGKFIQMLEIEEAIST